MEEKISDFVKTRTAEKNSFYGRVHSEESKRKIGAANKGKRPANAKMIVVDEIEYSTRQEAELATGIKAATLYFRARSNNPKFNNIYFKEHENDRTN